MRLKCKNDKGVAGLTILLSLVTMLFVIGLLVMIYALMGGELMNADSVIASETVSGLNDVNLVVNETGINMTTCQSYNQGAISSISRAVNVTGNISIASGNYTFSGCEISYSGVGDYNNTIWNVTYAITYAGTSWDVMNDTVAGVSTVTDWYPIFIVIGAMVVLVLLTVIIITAIRGSGLMTQGSA